MTNSGKSHVWKQMPDALEKAKLNKNFVFKSVSSDEIRAEVTDSIMKKRHNLSKDDAFQ